MLPQAVLTDNDNPCYVVCDRGTDRSRLQLFTPDGNYIRSIRLPNVQLVSGLTATQDRKIIVVDSLSGDVFVLSEFGDHLFYFNCGTSEQMVEPGDIAIHNNQYFICDFKGHSVCVFNENGDYVLKFGQNVVNYPNGIDISDSGEVLIADSHGNQLHINVFNADTYRKLGSFGCFDIRVSGCVGLKVTTDGYLLSLSKNNQRVMVLEPIQIVEEDEDEWYPANRPQLKWSFDQLLFNFIQFIDFKSTILIPFPHSSITTKFFQLVSFQIFIIILTILHYHL